MNARDFKELRHETYPADILNEWFRNIADADSQTLRKLYADLLTNAPPVKLVTWLKLIE